MAERHRAAKTLSLGAVIADVDGHIAYVQTGRSTSGPRLDRRLSRNGWDLSSRQPAPLPERARPFVLDPEEGFVVSANEFNRGRHGEWWSTLPEPIYRWQRLRQSWPRRKPDMNALVRASYDSVDLCAERLMAVWKRPFRTTPKHGNWPIGRHNRSSRPKRTANHGPVPRAAS